MRREWCRRVWLRSRGESTLQASQKTTLHWISWGIKMEWLRISVVVAAVAVCANMAEAQWAFQPQSRGANVAGRGGTAGGTTYYNNTNGSSAGRATTMGNMAYFNNANGSSAGRAMTMSNTTYYYNANGSSAGRSTRVGNTTYFYNANGSSAGTATTPGR